MPNKNGYLPLGDHDDHDDHDEQELSTQDPARDQHPDQDQDPHEQVHVEADPIQDRLGSTADSFLTVTPDKGTNSNKGVQSTWTETSASASTRPSIHPRPAAFEDSLQSSGTLAPSATTPAIVHAHSEPLSSSRLLNSGQTSFNSSSSTPLRFPRFGQHKSLLGLQDRLLASSSRSQSSYARLVGSKSLGPIQDLPPDLAHIRPKQHPHTTHSGPRGIQKSQKRQVLREIRPDPHNLPEELLREQAKGGAAVSGMVLMNPNYFGNNNHHNNQHHPSGGMLDPRTGVDPSSPLEAASPGSGHANGERGTLLGSGDGLGLGIGLGGKAHSRWNRPRLGRQRRVPSSGKERDHRVIQSSVFTPVLVSVDGGQPVTPAPTLTPDHADPMTSERFVAIVDSVKEAIFSGIQPLRIAQGSSGSYFCRNLDGKIVGVFKPKNEEPYGQLNPKWAKWIHRNLFPCCFGRSCLIPNLGYISESATSLVDRRLKLNIVPSTEVVWLSSSAFHYDYLDRRANQSVKGSKPLPDKVGSFQLFLNGFKDANLFMRDHPWPVDPPASTDGTGKNRSYGTWRRSAPTDSIHSQDTQDGSSVYGSITGSTHGGLAGGSSVSGPDRPGFNWTPALQQQFREQFEKMIILDYLIRNTDRGLDNWMIRYCEKEGFSIVADAPVGPQKGGVLQPPQAAPPRRNSRVGDLLGLYSERGSFRSSSSSLGEAGARNGMLVTPPGTPPRSNLSRATSGMEVLRDEDVEGGVGRVRSARPTSPTPRSQSESESLSGTGTGKGVLGKDSTSAQPTMASYYGPTHVHVAAIDNGLAFPFKHPDSWRSYPYGWLFLPRPLISQPFTKATRDHFLPMLSSPVWWRETIADLRRLFSIDSDFDQGMFDKQMAVMKGQGWNIVETLKNLEQGPMDLCRRVALVVWDEEVTLESSVISPGSGFQGQAPSAVLASYTNKQPTAKTMDASSAGHHYGTMGSSVGHLGDRFSTAKTLSVGSTAGVKGGAISQQIPPRVVVEEERNSQPRHDSFRQVVSDGEYDLNDDEDDDDDYDFSYDEEYDDFDEERYDDDEEEGFYLEQPHKDDQENSKKRSKTPPPVGSRMAQRDGMVSIDMALSEAPEGPASPRRRRGRSESGTRRNHRRRQSHQSERTVRPRPRPSGASNEQGAPTGDTAIDIDLSTAEPPLNGRPTIRNHRRRRTEQDDKTGTIRFEGRTGEDPVVEGTSLLKPDGGSRGFLGGVGPLDVTQPSKHVEEGQRGRGFFAQGYDNIESGGGGGGEGERLSERPKWADRLRRGLSFDGHLLVGGIGEAARKERKMRKQKQRERELREHRVVVVERIEAVTTNLPYFKWW